MKSRISKRRAALVEAFVRTWSVKSAVKVVSKKFNVSEAALRTDWYKRDTWSPEVFDGVTDSAMRDVYLLGVHRTLRQIEYELANNENPSCRVGLLKAKAEIFFKLIELQEFFDNQVLLKRIEALEERQELLDSDKQTGKVT